MSEQRKEKVALVTGAAGFIGFHISKKLLQEGWKVIGLDCMSDYYDVSLKHSRENILMRYKNYTSIHEKVEQADILKNIFAIQQPELVIHLAAQAGVRYSIDNPRAYLESNIVGTFELLEAARANPPKHMLLASTSSAYGANEQMPFKENHKSDHQMSFYAATKKSCENICHSYSHLFSMPITMFRFFTVYGPWGRPDMALFKFTSAILNRKKLDVFNYGNMKRDFTFIDDLVESIYRLIDCVPSNDNPKSIPEDSISPVAPFRVVNIGNAEPISLIEYIRSIEKACQATAELNMLPMQAGDVSETFADVNLLYSLTNFKPTTPVEKGVLDFVNWYRSYYN